MLKTKSNRLARGGVLLGLFLVLTLGATAADAAKAKEFERRESIWLGSFGTLSGWKPVARDQLVVWASPRRAFLVGIDNKHRRLRSAYAIGVTQTAGRVTDFDYVIVDGWRYPIRSIERIDGRIARALKYDPA